MALAYIFFPIEGAGMVGFKVWMSFLQPCGEGVVIFASSSKIKRPSSRTGSRCRSLWSQIPICWLHDFSFPWSKHHKKLQEVQRGRLLQHQLAGREHHSNQPRSLQKTKRTNPICGGSWSARQRPRLCEYSALLLLRRSRSKARDVQRVPGWALERVSVRRSQWAQRN